MTAAPAGARLAALVRMGTGVIFIAEGAGKMLGGFVRGGFARQTTEMLSQAWPFWAGFLRAVVLPRAGVFAWLIAAGELAVGTGLLIGLWTRAAAAGGALLMLSILLAQSYPAAGAGWDKWITAGLATKFALLLLLLIAAADAGRVWGLDANRSGPRRGIRR
ncbi:MAG: DoxX family protein [Acidobacteriota bacterium]|nr:DoxX family protein [Acidobacteriota bacterium]